MQNQLIKTFNDKEIRIITQENGEIWFVAKDLCDALGIINHKDTISKLPNDEKLRSVLPTLGQNRSYTIISESAMYKVIFQSNKPNALIFTDWVTKEVLPSIRKHGRYVQDNYFELLAEKKTLLQAKSLLNEKINDLNKRIENTTTYKSIEPKKITDLFSIQNT